MLELLSKTEFLASPIKYILIYLFMLIGLNVDIEPMRLFIWLWMFDGISFFVKTFFLSYANKIISTIKYSASHLGIILIPIALVVLMGILGKDTEWSYKSTLAFFSGFIFLNFTGNVISCKTHKEYNFDGLIDRWIKNKQNEN